MYKILIIDDHELIIHGIDLLLRPFPHFQVVGSTHNGLSAYPLCRETRPDIIILDLGLPGMEGQDVLVQLMRRWPAIRVVVYTARQGEHHAAKVISLGAAGFVSKMSPARRLLEAIEIVAAGKRYIDPILNHSRLGRLLDDPANDALSLTPRERQVLKQIAEGAGNQSIASTLSISPKTVETHRLNIMRKLDVHKATELVLWSHRLGLVE
ncbi:two component system response regulator [Sodalis ligni]|uniref:two component system response regulator n=1 Tax=Sodalis ligni TaxID=2697027 RepID=UPI00193F09AA|nr:two component system response regulator [Sodalis ligni]QWA11554.1 two component system response regulator [Sodalis ligni]